jgi:hypothetical protein
MRASTWVTLGLVSLSTVCMTSGAFAAGDSGKNSGGIRFGGRSPASVSESANAFNVPMLTLPKKQESQPRWRLLGTCRNDVGTQQSFTGLGYGNCAHR